MNNNFLSKPMGVTVIGKQEESECDHKGQFMCTKGMYASYSNLATSFPLKLSRAVPIKLLTAPQLESNTI